MLHSHPVHNYINIKMQKQFRFQSKTNLCQLNTVWKKYFRKSMSLLLSHGWYIKISHATLVNWYPGEITIGMFGEVFVWKLTKTGESRMKDDMNEVNEWVGEWRKKRKTERRTETWLKTATIRPEVAEMLSLNQLEEWWMASAQSCSLHHQLPMHAWYEDYWLYTFNFIRPV